MTDAQIVDLIKTVVTPMLGGGLALLGVYFNSRVDTKKRRQEMLRGRGEELYVLNEKWLNGLAGYCLGHAAVMQGKLTYNQVLDLDIADGAKNPDFSRIEMLIDVYFPAARTAYERVIAVRETMNKITSEHKRAYESGNLDGRQYLESFNKAIDGINISGAALKEAILHELRSI